MWGWTQLRTNCLVATHMGLEWVLLSLMTVVALWLGMDACRESKRLHARLARVQLPRRAEGDLAYWSLITSSEDSRSGPGY
jgi:hypothetical protein